MKQWRFVSNQNATIVGLNDAGIETFTNDLYKSIVRETLQNSLDAKKPDSNEPVEVEFHLFEMARDRVPHVYELQSAIQKCKNSNKDEPDAEKFFRNAYNIITKDKIEILRISDHNTIGLEGSLDGEKGKAWSRLVKESGSSNKSQDSGGSFGIGKAAAFACSDLRTVFYSSIDTMGIESNIGVAKLISFEDERLGWTTGTGYYSEDERFVGINELSTFDSNYIRQDTGTDIYILGMHSSSDFESLMIEAVLMDFFVSIWKNKLIVHIQNQTISKETLAEHMYKLEFNYLILKNH